MPEALRDVRHARRVVWMQTVPAFCFDGIGVEAFVAGDAPDIGGNAIILFENFLRLERFVEDRAAAENLRATACRL